MNEDDLERALAIEREIQQLLWSVKPLLSAGRDDEAGRLALELRDELARRGEWYGAASASSLAATFLGRAGDRSASMEAAQLATSLHPDPQFKIDHARRHMRNGDLAAASTVLEAVLAGEGLAPSTEHHALATLARVFAADGGYEQACSLLDRSRQVAVERSLPPPSWDVEAARDLIDMRVCMAEVHTYLTALLDHARSDGAQFVAEEVRRLLSRLGT